MGKNLFPDPARKCKLTRERNRQMPEIGVFGVFTFGMLVAHNCGQK
jgi:hypothetical protein